jgi:hypothetical protein
MTLGRTMRQLLIFEGTYYSQSDEDAFFGWLRSIPGVVGFVGTPEGLEVTLRSGNVGQGALRDLLALHYRYQLPMKDLAQFQTDNNSSWFPNPIAYWHLAVFGPNAVSARIEDRFAQLRECNATAAEAIKAVRIEYRLPLNEAKRRLSISKSWQLHTRASAPSQEEAIKAMEMFQAGGEKVRPNNAFETDAGQRHCVPRRAAQRER